MLCSPGHAVGMHLKGLDRSAVIPRSGDVAIGASDISLSVANSFSANIQVLDTVVLPCLG